MREMKTQTKINDDLELEFPEAENILVWARKMVRELAYDICEMPFTTYIAAKSVGKKFTALPLFITRNFHHQAIHVAANAGLSAPKDMEGKTAGIVRGYTVTTGVWARYVLSSEYDVDLSKVQWTCTDDEHVGEFTLPDFADYNSMGKDFKDLFGNGDIVGAVGTLPEPIEGVQPLIGDPKAAGFASYHKTGVFPVNHGIVVRDELLEQYPDLAVDLFNALKSSKDAYLASINREGDLSAEDALTVELENGVGGDPFPYGVEPNRLALEALTQTAYDQRITPRKFSVEELFAEGTHDLVG
ncbi:MAG: 4,5-dihydroxyphthalate decarboxylase [Rhodospirillaceae bacterium]|nr:4,5-dihydroxyphthalate decarboxylase [Rhodospirillaceae bacterium]